MEMEIEIDEQIQKEIRTLAFTLHIENCEGCRLDYPSQKDHTCLDTYHYHIALNQALNIIEDKYKLGLDFDYCHKKFHAGFFCLY